MGRVIKASEPDIGEPGGLVVNASDSGSRGRGSSPTRVKPCCVHEQGFFTPQKVLVIPRKRWLRPNMTEKLFTRTLRINQPTNQQPDMSYNNIWCPSVPNTHQPLYNTVCYNTILDMTRFNNGSQKCIDYIEK